VITVPEPLAPLLVSVKWSAGVASIVCLARRSSAWGSTLLVFPQASSATVATTRPAAARRANARCGTMVHSSVAGATPVGRV
jgi:hypothetical protein